MGVAFFQAGEAQKLKFAAHPPVYFRRGHLAGPEAEGHVIENI